MVGCWLSAGPGGLRDREDMFGSRQQVVGLRMAAFRVPGESEEAGVLAGYLTLGYMRVGNDKIQALPCEAFETGAFFSYHSDHIQRTGSDIRPE